jgi:hypothetical protein
MSTPAQEYAFIAALQSAEAIRQVARQQALAAFDPRNPVNFPLYTTAVAAADEVFRATVTAAALVAGVTLAPPGASS